MSNQKLRKQLAWESARLMYSREASEYHRAKRKAARRIGISDVKPRDLPSNREIQEQVEVIARLYDRDQPEPGICIFSGRISKGHQDDRNVCFESLLLALEKVKEDPQYHPEGDVLYHSLQVFQLAREEEPYDSEFLEAALLHDVGKAIDRMDHIAAGLAALADLITDRTAWFIRHHIDGQRLRDGRLGARARKRLVASEDFELLELLAKCDRAGRQCGVAVPDVDEAIAYLHELEQM
ncbi:MAG: HD domain-containing protein [Planctomycetia bacterium]